MGFTVNFCRNNSPVEKIGKDLSGGVDITGCRLQTSTSILQPVILIKTNEDIYNYNYMIIDRLNRCYFIDDIVSVNYGIWEVSGHVDVLETYKDEILANSAIMEGSEQLQINKYLPDDNVFITNCKRLTNILNFPSGLSETGEFILITAGG